MRPIFCAFLIALLAGCASRPPLPPECEGDQAPINAGKTMSDQGGRHEAGHNG
jgi:hypothetical protein